MSTPKPFRPPTLAGAPTARQTEVNSTVSLLKKPKMKGADPVLLKQADHSKTVPASGTANTAISGVGFGITIPGPDRSFMSVRIDAYCYLPHKPTAEAARAAMKLASELVQEQLESDAQEAYEFFQNAPRLS